MDMILYLLNRLDVVHSGSCECEGSPGIDPNG